MPSHPWLSPGPGPAPEAAVAAAIAHTAAAVRTTEIRLRISASLSVSPALHRRAPGGSLRFPRRQRRVDLPGQGGHLLRQLLVLTRQSRVRLEERLELVRLGLDRGKPLGAAALGLVVTLLRHLSELLVTGGLPRLRQQDQRRGVRRLGREPEVQENERLRIPVAHERDGVEDDPRRHDDRLAEDVLRCAEEARRFLGTTAESVLAEGAVLLVHARSVRT